MTQRGIDIAAIEGLSAEFGYHLDRGDLAGFLAVFTTDGLYTNGARRLHGHAEIAAFFEKRASDRRTSRHLYGPIRIRFDGDNRATGLSIWTTYSAAAAAPVIGTAPSVVADVEDVYVRAAGIWRIAERHITAIFIPVPAP